MKQKKEELIASHSKAQFDPMTVNIEDDANDSQVNETDTPPLLRKGISKAKDFSYKLKRP